MNEHSEELQPGNDADQRGKWQQRENIVFLVMFLLGSGLIIIPYKPPESQTVQWSLVHGSGMYAVAIVAALSFQVVARLSVRLLKLGLASLLFALLMIAPFVGSFDIASGLVRLTGDRSKGGDVALAVLLYVLTAIPLGFFVRRTTPLL